MCSKFHLTLDTLNKMLTKVRDQIDEDYLRAAVGSSEKHLKACLKAKGAYFDQDLA